MDEATAKRLLGLFVSEAEENLAALNPLAVRFQDPTQLDAIEEFCGTAHSFKGAAAAVGLPDMVWVVHRLEALAFRLRHTDGEARAELYRRLRRVLELLETSIAVLGAGSSEPGPEHAALRGLLADIEPDVLLAQAVEPRTAAPSAAASQEAAEERLSVPATEVDEALRLAASVTRLAAAQELDGGRLERRTAQELATLSQRLESVLFNLRMLPAAQALTGLDAEVRALAERLGKDVRVEMADHQVRADRRTLQTGRTMLRHLVRNALDHGFETPAERASAGKASQGTLKVALHMADASLWVTVEDDGGGFDVGAIRGALASRTAEPERISALSDSEVLVEFAAQGGSTRAQATDISGRGVGLSTVVAMARAKGGDLKLRSERGKGSTVSFTLPLEVYATEVLTVSCGSRRLGIPTSAIESTVTLGQGGLTPQRGPAGPILAFDERIIHLRPLGQLLGGAGGSTRFAVIVRAEQREVALGVDELGEATRVVPHALPPFASADTLVTGVALLSDGRQVHVLNPRHLVSLVRQEGVARLEEPVGAAALVEAKPAPAPAAEKRPGRRLSVLLAEDSLATREVLRVLLEREGFDVRVAGDGQEAQVRIAERLPDVLVSDFNMPVCDGPMLARAVRSHPESARLPVILLTSRDDARSRAEGAAAGADAYLIKSQFNAQLLRQTLRKLGVEG